MQVPYETQQLVRINSGKPRRSSELNKLNLPCTIQ